MKIRRDQDSKCWVLTAESHELYRGRKSPWDHPSILQEAQRRERAVLKAGAHGPRAKERPPS